MGGQQKVKRFRQLVSRGLMGLVVVVLSIRSARADEFNDGVNRDDPKFVTASLLVASPGNELFSCVGHAAIRLECPTFKLDYCFSYESERAVDRLPAFFAGKLKMGMFAVKTEEFLSDYRKDGRGARQYVLNLPPKVKRRLWRHMDELSAQGANLPYDYMQRGCAKSVLDCIKSAFAPQTVKGPLLEITQRETFNRELAETHPWNLFFLNAIVGTETDTFTEVVTPRNLLNYLRRAQVDGVPLLTDPGREILPQTLSFEKCLLSPFVAAWFVFALVAAICLLSWTRWSPSRQKEGAFSLFDAMGTIASTCLVRALLVAQFLAGCFFVYLVSASHLPNSCWNWLLVPFNPVMPAAMLASRLARTNGLARTGGGVYALVLVGWVAFMLLAPHAKTDPAYIVLAGVLAVVPLVRASLLARSCPTTRVSKLARTGGEARR